MTTLLSPCFAAVATAADSSPEMLETLVKLASAGTSGICVLAIFWCGVSIMRLPNDAPRNKHVTMRFFMGTCVFVAIISAGTTFGAGYWDYRRVAALRTENRQLAAANHEQKTSLEQIRTSLVATEGRLQVALREKVEFEKSTQTLTAQVAQLENRLRLRPGMNIVTPP